MMLQLNENQITIQLYRNCTVTETNLDVQYVLIMIDINPLTLMKTDGIIINF